MTELRRRVLGTCAATVMGLMTIWAVVLLVRWEGEYERIAYPAVEVGRAAHFAFDFMAYGWFIGTVAVALCAATILAAWYGYFESRFRVSGSFVRIALLVAAAILIGLALPTFVAFAVFGIVPLLAGVMLGVAAAGISAKQPQLTTAR